SACVPDLPGMFRNMNTPLCPQKETPAAKSPSIALTSAEVLSPSALSSTARQRESPSPCSKSKAPTDRPGFPAWNHSCFHNRSALYGRQPPFGNLRPPSDLERPLLPPDERPGFPFLLPSWGN